MTRPVLMIRVGYVASSSSWVAVGIGRDMAYHEPAAMPHICLWLNNKASHTQYLRHSLYPVEDETCIPSPPTPAVAIFEFEVQIA